MNDIDFFSLKNLVFQNVKKEEEEVHLVQR